MTKKATFTDWLAKFPLVAILRGVKPGEVTAIGDALVEAGFCIIEVPLNSPEPFASVMKLAKHFGDEVLIGAGTVTDWTQVAKVADAGGNIVVMPHSDERIVEAAKRRGIFVLPGFATPTEAFRMIDAGADGLKLFPAEAFPPHVLKALRAVLPANVPVLPVGGITPKSIKDYLAAGASGFGLGGALYKPGATAKQVAQAAADFRFAVDALPRKAGLKTD
ncbi:MAG TPA: 2-dehydro-3-deoxy-6-phosphogalactonate aldolase [Burkholderiales bacterium]|nr:2-dehydro-3-deoxy-6-phosphogalactonate aldolase [Burkholderiales bacterium]